MTRPLAWGLSALPWIVVVVLARDCAGRPTSAALEDARAAYDIALDTVEAVRARAEAAEASALAQDAVLARVADSVTAVVRASTVRAERSARRANLADSSLATSADSLRAHLVADTLGTRLLGQVVDRHAETRAADAETIAAGVETAQALRVEVGATRETAELWRSAHARSDSLVTGYVVALAAAESIAHAERALRIAAERDARKWKVVAVGQAAAVTLLAAREVIG